MYNPALFFVFRKENPVFLMKIKLALSITEDVGYKFDGRTYSLTIKKDLNKDFSFKKVYELINTFDKDIMSVYYYEDSDNIFKSKTYYYDFKEKRFIHINKKDLVMTIVYIVDKPYQETLYIYNNNNLYTDLHNIVDNILLSGSDGLHYAIRSIHESDDKIVMHYIKDPRLLYGIVMGV